MIAYPAKFKKAAEGGYVVEFIDIPSCITEGDTLEEAKSMAKEAISAMLYSLDSRKMTIPEPSIKKGKEIYYIEPELKIAFAITLKKERERMGLSQKDIAERMNVNWTYYQRIENPRRTNPTLGTIEKLQKVFQRQFISF
ncbi:MAG: helix-turn-helix domain-containing protein [Spirochaetaceae bacterium]|nr:helix-turn-helix domain-containing protein [Spirochaetaceae bacterium]